MTLQHAHTCHGDPRWASPPPRSSVTCDQIRGRKAQSTACVPAIMALVQDASLFAEEREVSISQDRRLIEVSSLLAWTHACCAHGCVCGVQRCRLRCTTISCLATRSHQPPWPLQLSRNLEWRDAWPVRSPLGTATVDQATHDFLMALLPMGGKCPL